MNIYYWQNFYKKKNSTRQPASSGTTASVTLKTPTSFRTPVIECSNVPKDANYFKIASGVWTAYDAYYFVTDVISVTNAIAEFHLTLDVLATYKSLIGTTAAYIVRADDTTNYNPLLTDPLNHATNDILIESASSTMKYGSSINVFDVSTFRYILSAVGNPDTGINYAYNNGVATNYIMSGASVALLCEELCSTSFLENLVKEFTNPMEAIIKCIALPVNLSGMTIHNDDHIYLGTHDTDVIVNTLVDRVLESTTLLDRPTSMEGSQTYLNHSPYVTATIYLPFVGVCPLDIDLVTGKSLTLKTTIDCFTGDITYAIKDTVNGTIYQTFSGNCSTDIPISSMNYSATATIGGLLSTAGGVISGSAGITAFGILNTVKSLENHTQTNGSYSSIISAWQGTDVVITLYKAVPAHAITDNHVQEGLPIERHALINTFSGFVLCRNASVEIPGCDADKEEINSLLNSGIFYE